MAVETVLERSSDASLSENATGRAALTWCGFGLSILLAGWARSASLAIESRILLGASGVVMACAAAALASASPAERRERSHLMLGVMMPAVAGVTYGLLSLRWLNGPAEDDLIQDRDEIARVFLVVVWGIAAWAAGYRLSKSPRIASGTHTLSRRLLPSAVPDTSLLRQGCIALGLGVLAQLLLATRNGLGYLSDLSTVETEASALDGLLDLAALLAPLGVAILALEYFRSRSFASRVALGLGLVTQTSLAAFSGSKQPVLILVVSVGLAGMAIGALRPRTVIVWSIVAVLVIFPFNARYRALLRPAPGQEATTSEALALFPDAIQQTVELAQTPRQYLDEGFVSSTGRASAVDAAAIVVAAHDGGRPSAGLSAFVDRVQLLVVPRVVWPDKPVDLFALDVTRNYYQNTSSFSASAITLFGDGYRYGGMIGVLLGLLYVGFISGLLDVALDHRRNLFGLVAMLAIAPGIVKTEGDLASFGVGLIRTAVVLIPLLWLIAAFGQQRSGRGSRL